MDTDNQYKQIWLSKALQREKRVVLPVRAILGLALFGLVFLERDHPELDRMLLFWGMSLPLHYYLVKKADAQKILLVSQLFIAYDSVYAILLATAMRELTGSVMLFIPILMLRAVFSGVNPQTYWLQGIPGSIMIFVLGRHNQDPVLQILVVILLLWCTSWMIVRLAQEYQQMIAKIERDSERLKHLANTDSLTGLANHRFFLARAKEAIHQEKRFAVIFVDIDDFKRFNETYGHLRGDQVLTSVSDQIRQAVRSTDLVARYGGEEFLILAPDLAISEVQAMADRLRESVAAVCGVTLSVGIAAYPEHGRIAEAVISAADMAMYFSKRSGKNRVSYLEDLMDFLYCSDLDPSVARAVSPLLTWLNYWHPETVEHARGVKNLVQEYAHWVGLSKEQTDVLVKASLVHDLGKGDIPCEVLDKRTKLDEQEWTLLKQHPALGVAGIAEITLLQDTIEIVRHHHEHWDGSGYPDGLKGEQIPCLARILAVADAYEAMTREKPYRSAFSPEQALAQLEEMVGSHFDPIVTNKFTQFIRKAQSLAG